MLLDRRTIVITRGPKTRQLTAGLYLPLELYLEEADTLTKGPSTKLGEKYCEKKALCLEFPRERQNRCIVYQGRHYYCFASAITNVDWRGRIRSGKGIDFNVWSNGFGGSLYQSTAEIGCLFCTQENVKSDPVQQKRLFSIPRSHEYGVEVIFCHFPGDYMCVVTINRSFCFRVIAVCLNIREI